MTCFIVDKRMTPSNVPSISKSTYFYVNYSFNEFDYLISWEYRQLLKSNKNNELSYGNFNCKEFPCDLIGLIFGYINFRKFKLFNIYDNWLISLTNQSLHGLWIRKGESAWGSSAVSQYPFRKGDKLEVIISNENNNGRFTLGIMERFNFGNNIRCRINSLYDLRRLGKIYAYDGLYSNRVIKKLQDEDFTIEAIPTLYNGNKLSMSYENDVIVFRRNQVHIISLSRLNGDLTKNIVFYPFITLGTDATDLELFY